MLIDSRLVNQGASAPAPSGAKPCRRRIGLAKFLSSGLARLFRVPRLVMVEVETLDFPPGWKRIPRIPVIASTLPEARAVLEAIHTGETITFIYEGGTTPGVRRRVSPGFLFMLEGYPHLYFSAYCHVRGENRTFRLDRCRAIA